MSAIFNGLEAEHQGICLVLPALHALTGSDFTAAFYVKGKIKALKLVC